MSEGQKTGLTSETLILGLDRTLKGLALEGLTCKFSYIWNFITHESMRQSLNTESCLPSVGFFIYTNLVERVHIGKVSLVLFYLNTLLLSFTRSVLHQHSYHKDIQGELDFMSNTISAQ